MLVIRNLNYRLGISYHRISKDIRLALHKPLNIFGFIKDVADLRLKSDFEWLNPGPYYRAKRQNLPKCVRAWPRQQVTVS
jgi:hypothetical protein